MDYTSRKYLKSFRLLRDNTLVQLFDLSHDQIPAELEGREKKSIEGYDGWEGTDGTFLVHFEENGIIYPSIVILQKMLEVGIKSDRAYFSFCPLPEEFLSSRNDYINDLIRRLSLDETKLDASVQSLTYIENVMHSMKFKTRQQIESLYLGILAYCGDTVCKVMDGEWLIKQESGIQFDSGWEPLIKLKSGKILDPFPYLHEGLISYTEEGILPMIDLRPTNEFQTPSRRFYSTSL